MEDIKSKIFQRSREVNMLSKGLRIARLNQLTGEGKSFS